MVIVEESVLASEKEDALSDLNIDFVYFKRTSNYCYKATVVVFLSVKRDSSAGDFSVSNRTT